jgi:protein gp37
MSEKTGISWTDATFNPWWGCQKVSPACDHCYAERDAKRFAPGKVLWGVGSERRTFEDKHWKAPTDWAKQKFVECMGCGWRGSAGKLTRKANLPGFDRDPGPMAICGQCLAPALKEARMRVFCASMADWLDLDAPISEFVRLLDVIRATPELDWLLLSKRIGNWRKRLEEARAFIVGQSHTQLREHSLAEWIGRWLDGNPPANVWPGSTVINQEEADRDVPKLLAVPARVRFLSIEPMLGPINLGAHLWQCCGRLAPGTNHGLLGQEPDHCCGNPDTRDALHWVIAGGESGPHARPAHPDWFRSLAAQCSAAGVAFFMKQMGGHPDKRADMEQFPPELRVQEFPNA